MSLRGSLETVDLAEVLEFLSGTGKTGKLHLRGSGGEGSLWFSDGRLAAFSTRNTDDPSEAIFEMLRVDDAEFTFVSQAADDDAETAGRGDWDVEPALATAREKLVEWVAIVEMVPSLDHRVELVADVAEEEITLRPDQWSLVVAVGAGRRVGDLLEACRLSEFEGCRAVRDLVAAGLARVTESEDRHPVEPADHPTSSDFQVGSGPLAWTGTDDPGPDPVHHAPTPDEVEPAPAGAGEVESVHDQPDDQPASTTGDPYAALRAAMLSIGDDLVAEPAAEEQADHLGSDQPAEAYDDAFGDGGYEGDDRAAGGRTALEALLAEVGDVGEAGEVGPAEEAYDETYDQIYVPDDGEAEEETTTEAAPSEEPINRGLLLKFLSSVRN